MSFDIFLESGPHSTLLEGQMFVTFISGLISEHLHDRLYFFHPTKHCFQWWCLTLLFLFMSRRDTNQPAYSEWKPGSNRSLYPVRAESCLLLLCRGLEQCGQRFPPGTRCIIDGWLIGNSITQRLLGWQTLGHHYPVRTIELEQRKGGKVSFRDASFLSSDLLGMPNSHSLVHTLTDDLPSNCSFSQVASWVAMGRGKKPITHYPV